MGDSRALENAPVSQILTLAWVLIAYALVGLRSAIRYRPSHASLDLYCLVWLVLFRRPMRRGEDVGIWGFKCPVSAGLVQRAAALIGAFCPNLSPMQSPQTQLLS